MTNKKKQIKQKRNKKKIELKEIKLRPGIDKHDYQVKLKALSKFIGGGNKVKVSMRFRGREMEHQNLGFDLLAGFLLVFSVLLKFSLHILNISLDDFLV